MRNARQMNGPMRRAMSTFEEQVAESKQHAETIGTFRNVSYLGMVACVIIAYKSFFLAEHEHAPEFKPWSHMRKRATKFPWGDGDHSLFHNPEANALPSGYEEGAHH
ncbi:uncharacterized protein MONBRDRAFT_38196 [Monosiga brevicollis MX1]|uniref:Cytochrome c oxidase subunit n=1 Tax=Monosiga brevicollis TaxID=81824 RepID=A9V685_MONBE|nr:uncharacterized protein MONBRDRAFT_38196 [Monosiga brevicollis MX1]EDQ86945.1 predicted protein [Monosiga brevicollis MX1]|eukprot:XP_001748184.1 hypothetical protein [Monosiga brevicollis MX1]